MNYALQCLSFYHGLTVHVKIKFLCLFSETSETPGRGKGEGGGSGEGRRGEGRRGGGPGGRGGGEERGEQGGRVAKKQLVWCWKLTIGFGMLGMIHQPQNSGDQALSLTHALN